MKAFLVSVLLLIAITVGSSYALKSIDMSARSVYSTSNVRF